MSQHFAQMRRYHRRNNPGFLPQVPAGDLHAWIARQNGVNKAPAEGNDRNVGLDRVHVRHPCDNRSGLSIDADRRKRKRSDMPFLRRVDKGLAERAENAASSAEGKKASLENLIEDMYANTSRRPRDAQLSLWIRFHGFWFGPDGGDPFPLDEIKLIRVSSLFKAGGYKSFKNYLSRAKDHHVSLGYSWSDNLARTAQKCSRSVLRGLARAGRSEAFDLLAIAQTLGENVGSLAVTGPSHPLAMIVCSTFFMLRELEASAVDRSDVSFGCDSVTLSLPVSKTDWEAKGCKRTWSCVCDRNMPCPFHVLRRHCDRLDSRNTGFDMPLFPDDTGSYCTKQGVIDTIRFASELAGQPSKDSSGNYILSGHTFRITGARFLAANGLDPITIQLLGRWGSNAVLTYLAEAPLMSLTQRLKPLESQRLSSAANITDGQFGELDQRVKALETLSNHQDNHESLIRLSNRCQQLETSQEDINSQLEGISVILDQRREDELMFVINLRSDVKHKAVVNLSTSPHSWKTLCGWKFSGKLHARTEMHGTESQHVGKICPKCFALPGSDSEDSSSTSSDD